MSLKRNSFLALMVIKAFNKNFETTATMFNFGADSILKNNNLIDTLYTLKNPYIKPDEKKEATRGFIYGDAIPWIGGNLIGKVGNTSEKLIYDSLIFKNRYRYDQLSKAFKHRKESHQLLRLDKDSFEKFKISFKDKPFEAIKKMFKSKGSKEIVSQTEKRFLLNIFRTPVGKIAGPVGIIAGELGEEVAKSVINGEKLSLKILNKSIAPMIGGLIGFGLGTAIAGPVGGAILSSIGSSFTEFIAKKIAKRHEPFLQTNPSFGTFAAVKPAATGIPRVPYDNFPALLHEGESVLTKRETSNLANGMGSVHIAKLSDTIIIREEADIDRIASALTMRIRHAALNMA